MSDYDPDDPRLIHAAEESGLAVEYAGDPTLLRFYMVKLLKWRWAGQKQPTESRCITLARKAMGKSPPGGLCRRNPAQAKSTERSTQDPPAPKQVAQGVPAVLPGEQEDLVL